MATATTDPPADLPTLPTTTSPITTPHTINIGTRKSHLARVQTDIVVAHLRKHWPQHNYVVHAISTMGDKNQVTELHNFGAKSLWTHELEGMLLGRELDFIVHSLKDIPTHLPPQCTLGAILSRTDARDALVMHSRFFLPGVTTPTLSTLPAGAIIGTSSVRRSAQLKRLYPQLDFLSVRGNIETRVSKLDAKDSVYSGLILAAAGLIRVDLGHRISGFLESRNVEGEGNAADRGQRRGEGQLSARYVADEAWDGGSEARDMEARQRKMGDRRWGMLHAVGQGALGIETREEDPRVDELLRPLKDEKAGLACLAERSLMRTLEGGCSVPIGVETEWVDSTASNEGNTAGRSVGADRGSGQQPSLGNRDARIKGDGSAQHLTMRAIVVSLDGKEAAEAEVTKQITTEEHSDDFGREVALLLVQRGAEKILAAINLDRDVIENQEGGA